MGTEQAEIERLYLEVGPTIYRRCLRLLGERELARDATQDVFLKLLRQHSRLTDSPASLPWVFAVTTNHCLNFRRNLARRGEKLQELPIPEAVPAESFAERHLGQQLLGRFDTTTQAIAVGVLVDGMEHDEVAELLGVSRKTVGRKLDRFLQRARLFLARGDS